MLELAHGGDHCRTVGWDYDSESDRQREESLRENRKKKKKGLGKLEMDRTWRYIGKLKKKKNLKIIAKNEG